jgi:branched-chain amino acid transport system permease protein
MFRRYAKRHATRILLLAVALFTLSVSLLIPLPAISLAETLQLIVGGVLSGSIYAVAAIGLALVFGIMRIINLAHGALMVLASYITFWAFVLLGIDPFMSLAITIPTLFIIGIAIERVALEPVIGLGPDQTIIITFAILLIIESLIKMFWTADVRGVSTTYVGSSINVWSISVPVVLLGVFAVVLAGVASIHLILSRTYLGKSFRATSQDLIMAETVGVDTRKAYMLAFGVGSAYAGLAGTLIAASYAFDPSSDILYLFRAFAVVVLAGLGNVKTVLLAGILLGVVEVFGGYFLGGSVKDAFSFLIFLLVLFVRPSGLAGKIKM